MRVGGDGRRKHLEGRNHGHVFAHGLGEQCLIDAFGVVGGVGQHIDTTVDGDADAGEVRRMREDELAVEMAFFDGRLGDVEGHRQDVTALDPGTGEELGNVRARSKIATNDAAG